MTRWTSRARAASSTLTSPSTLTWMLSAGLAAETAPKNVARLEVDLVDDIGDEAVVAMARKHDGPVPLVDELAAGLGADDSHSAGDENPHCRLIRSWHRPR